MKKILLLLCALLGTVGTWATDVTVIDKAKDATTYGSLSSGTFTTNAASGVAGVTISGISGTTATSFSYGACLSFTSVQNGTVTMTAPTGYIITGYALTARSNTYAVSYTLTPSAGGSAVTTSTGGVNLTASGLSDQTASFTFNAGSANSFYIPSLVINVMSTSAQTVNVTYELWDNGGASAISSEIKVQEANSAISAPASWTSSPIYSYTTQGTIGDSDCTIKVIRTKIGVETTADLSNSKCYTIRTYDRGWWVVPASATQVTSTTKASLATDASDLKQRFAFITYDDTDDANDGIYLYSVSEKKFISKSGSNTTLTATPGDKTTLPASTGDNNFPTVVALNGYHAGISNGYNPAVITSWQSLSDGGNRCAIIEAADFDPTEALAALNEYFHPSYTVTYIVKDGSDNVLFTSEPVATTNGANITTLPAEYQRSAFYTYNTVDVTINSSGNTSVEFTATPKSDAPVKYTADTSNPYYYNLNIRSKYLVYNSEATGQVTLQDTSEPFNANASWAFIGEPYAGFKVINQAKGTGSYLTYTNVEAGRHSNNNIQFVDNSNFSNQYWIIDNNTGGFVLRMKENTSIYFHHDSGKNYLRTCSVSEWSAVHNDAGSTIVASTDEDVLFALYNSMKDYTYGTAIGQYSAEGVGAADANATISSVGAAIDGNMTSAYAAAYAALNELQAKTSLNAPTAGFYRVKNIATNGYLYATAAAGYTSTDRYVYANGNNSGAETIVQLVEHEGHLFMLNQGHEFGWVAQSSTGSGQVGYVKANNFDKYVNWLPGTAAGQIAFAICYGNGTGSYASYLTQGIYAVDTQDNAVIRGTDYTENAAQWTFEEVTSINVNISDAGYATLCVPFPVTIPSGVNAYTATTDGTTLSMTGVTTTIPAGTAVILEGNGGEYTFEIAAANTDAAISSDLVGNYFESTVPVGNYVLQKQEKVGFFQVQDEPKAIKANRAYLSVPSGSPVKAFFFGDTEDAIQSVISGAASAEIYNVTGQRVNKLQRGVNIVNGKKVLVK